MNAALENAKGRMVTTNEAIDDTIVPIYTGSDPEFMVLAKKLLKKDSVRLYNIFIQLKQN